MIRPIEEPDNDELLVELNRKLAEKCRLHNLAPDPEMGGLSPEQVSRLIYYPWEADAFPMEMSNDLPLSSCERSRLFRNCRRLLIAIHAAGGVKITSGGNLTRAFVAQMTELLEINQENLALMRTYKKTINEEDVREIHLTRIICICAKLLRPYKGKFRILKKAERLLDEGHAGKLYRQLFIGLFTEFNLAYMDGRCPCHAIQNTLPYILYRLGKLTWDHWRTIEEMPSEVLLPAVLAEVEEECSSPYSQSADKLLSYRALRPLVELGLLDGQQIAAPHGFSILKTISLSPLFNEFLSFPELP